MNIVIMKDSVLLYTLNGMDEKGIDHTVLKAMLGSIKLKPEMDFTSKMAQVPKEGRWKKRIVYYKALRDDIVIV